ncbi:MAG: MBL fold metallo-hydrolase [Thermodesulfovibrionales bacterium]
MLRAFGLAVLLIAGLAGYRPANATGGAMNIHTVVVGQLGVNCYIVSDGRSPEAIVIDPGDEPERIAETIDRLGLKPKAIVFTHAHYDHICAMRELKDRYRAAVMMHEDDRPTYQSSKERCVSWGLPAGDFPSDIKTLKQGDRISAGSLSFEVVHTPGHTPGSLCLYGNKTLFTGDTLFKGSVGRTDLAGGSTEKLMGSLKKLLAFPPDTKVLCGHGEDTTLEREAKSNPFLNNRSGLRLYP